MLSRLYKTIATNMVMLSAVSLCMPSNASAYYAQDPCCEMPCDDGCCRSGANWWSLGGALLVGAAAGAAAGAAVSHSHKGHDGHRGPTGPIGPTGAIGAIGVTGPTGPAGTFASDANSLIFANTLDVTVAPGTGTTALAFVSEPDGTVLETAPVAITGVSTVIFPPIVVTPSLFGTYTAGVQILTGTLAITATVAEDVTATRDGSTTTILNATPALSIPGITTQTSADFTYGAPPLP